MDFLISRAYAPEGGRLTRVLREVDPRVMDLLMAVLLSVAAAAILIGRSGTSSFFNSDDLLGIALVMMQTLPLAARSVSPLGVLIAISIAVVSHSALGYAQVQAGTFSSLIALYSVAALTNNRTGMIGAAISASAVTAFFATNRGDWSWPVIASTAATWLVAWVAGTFVRLRKEQLEVAGARAARLEIEQEIRAREAVADERARMARELHDIVGHALNLIVLQASGATRVYDAKPEVPREALASIESNGRDALIEMERMLGVLRATQSEDVTAGTLTGLEHLETLAHHVSEAGLQVSVVIEGKRPEVPASVDLSAYRIVQESLTNCLKHSGATRATVTVRYRRDALEVEVVDNGRGPVSEPASPAIGGRGQLGMRERVAVFGGEIHMGPAPSGGYCVRARLPFLSMPA